MPCAGLGFGHSLAQRGEHNGRRTFSMNCLLDSMLNPLSAFCIPTSTACATAHKFRHVWRKPNPCAACGP
jgi:hypothetical protein